MRRKGLYRKAYSIDRSFLLSLLFFYNFGKLIAQTQPSGSQKDSIIFCNNHFSFHISLLENEKSKIKQNIGYYPISSSSSSGCDFGFLYHLNWGKKISLTSGISAQFISRNLSVNFYKNDFSPMLAQDYHLNKSETKTSTVVLNLPIQLQKRFWYKAGRSVGIETGLGLNLGLGADDDITSVSLKRKNGTIFNVMNVDVNANNNRKVWISYLLGCFHTWRLNNNNLVTFSISSNLSSTKFINGVYKIYIDNKPSYEGQYFQSAYNLNFSFSYVFTNGNFHLIDFYRKRS